MRRATAVKLVLAFGAIVAVVLYWRHWIHEQRALERADVVAQKRAAAARRAEWMRRFSQPLPPLPGARVEETPHYRITTTADEAQTRRIGDAAEALHAAWLAFFRDLPGVQERADAATAAGKLRLTLYANRAEFQANNRSSWWAEAYYRRPVCYAYFPKNERSPYQWMVHEATHQMNTEVGALRLAKWANEGLSDYFSTSVLRDGQLQPGRIDPDTHPVWHLATMGLTGSLDRDVREGRIIPLRALITGIDAPPIDRNVNRYYIEYWSLVHFLLHGEDGRHAAAFRRVVARGGTLDAFIEEIGPPERIELAWYRYLDGLAKRYGADVEGDGVSIVIVVASDLE